MSEQNKNINETKSNKTKKSQPNETKETRTYVTVYGSAMAVLAVVLSLLPCCMLVSLSHELAHADPNIKYTHMDVCVCACARARARSFARAHLKCFR